MPLCVTVSDHNLLAPCCFLFPLLVINIHYAPTHARGYILSLVCSVLTSLSHCDLTIQADGIQTETLIQTQTGTGWSIHKEFIVAT